MSDWVSGGCVASSRFAAPPLRSGPPGDPTQPPDTRASMAENEFPAIPGPVCEKTAFREVNPHILCSPFIRASWQPLTSAPGLGPEHLEIPRWLLSIRFRRHVLPEAGRESPPTAGLAEHLASLERGTSHLVLAGQLGSFNSGGGTGRGPQRTSAPGGRHSQILRERRGSRR